MLKFDPRPIGTQPYPAGDPDSSKHKFTLSQDAAIQLSAFLVFWFLIEDLFKKVIKFLIILDHRLQRRGRGSSFSLSPAMCKTFVEIDPVVLEKKVENIERLQTYRQIDSYMYINRRRLTKKLSEKLTFEFCAQLS